GRGRRCRRRRAAGSISARPRARRPPEPGTRTRDSARGIVRAMTTSLARFKDGYTNGGRSVALRFMQSFRSVPLTPNQLTVTGFLLNVVAGVLIYQEHWVWAAVVFVAARVSDALAGALARARAR